MLQVFKKISLSVLLAALSSCNLWAQSSLSHKLYINEVMQSSFGGDLDMLKEYPDGWIELYNPSSQTISLNNYRIGKKNKFSKCFKLPNVSVSPKGYCVIFCDNEDTIVTVNYRIREVHTDFKLTTNNESTIFLFDSNEQLVDTFHLPKLFLPGVAYGRLTDGNDSIGPEMKVTRAAANSGGLGKAILPQPVLSVSDCILDSEEGSITSTQYVWARPTKSKLSDNSKLPDETVCRYTTDGTEPTANSPILGKSKSSALSFKTKHVLKTAYFCDGYVTPPAESHYFLFHGHNFKLPAVILSANNDDLNSKEYGIFENQPKDDAEAKIPSLKKNWLRPAQLIFFPAGQSTPLFSQRCEIRVGGGYTRINKLKSVVVFADDRFATPNTFEYNFWRNTRSDITSVPSLILRTSGNDNGSSYMRDAVSQMVFASYTDLDWQGCQPAVYYINDEYKGLINIRERANEDNIWTHYDSLSDITLIEITQEHPQGECKLGDYGLYEDFYNFCSEPGQPFEEYQKLMDLNEYTNYMICEIFFGNTDFPANNYVLWRPNTEDGKWRWIIKDVDRAFNIWQSCPANGEYLKWILNEENNITFDKEHNDPYHTLMFRNLINTVPEYRDMFVEHFLIYMGDFLTSNNINYWINFFANQMRPEMKYFNGGNGSWENELNSMKKWGAGRLSSMYDQLTERFSLDLSDVQVNNLVRNQESQYYNISINGVELTKAKMTGKLPTGREYVFSGSHSSNRYEIIGWNFTETKNGQTNSWTEMQSTAKYTPSAGVTAFTANAIQGTSGIQDTESDMLDIVEVMYYNTVGQSSTKPFHGLNIVKYILSDGSVVAEKQYIR